MDCLIDFVIGVCRLDKRRASPEILTVNQIFISGKTGSVEGSRLTGKPCCLARSGFAMPSISYFCMVYYMAGQGGHVPVFFRQLSRVSTTAGAVPLLPQPPQQEVSAETTRSGTGRDAHVLLAVLGPQLTTADPDGTQPVQQSCLLYRAAHQRGEAELLRGHLEVWHVTAPKQSYKGRGLFPLRTGIVAPLWAGT